MKSLAPPNHYDSYMPLVNEYVCMSGWCMKHDVCHLQLIANCFYGIIRFSRKKTLAPPVMSRFQLKCENYFQNWSIMLKLFNLDTVRMSAEDKVTI